MAQFLKEDIVQTLDTQPTHFHGLKRLEDGTLIYVRSSFYDNGGDSINFGAADEMIPTILEFTADGQSGTFDIDFFAATPSDIEVWVDQNKLDPFNDYSINNDKVEIDPVPTIGSKVFVLFIQEDVTAQQQPSADGEFSLRNNLTRELVNINSVFDQHKLDTKDLYYYINNNGELVARRASTDTTRDPLDIL